MNSPRAAIAALPSRGYRWWYVDGLADDGRRGFTAIFLVGSVFSPWLNARARRGEAVHPTEHLGVHLALYENDRQVGWTMAEYPAARLASDDSSLSIGDCHLRFFDDGSIEGELSTRSAPVFWSGLGFGRALRGRFRLAPGFSKPSAVELARAPDGASHQWQVQTPSAPFEVEFERPNFSFQGRGYHDGNWGDGRLEEAFSRWSWARFSDGRDARILYAVEPRVGEPRGFVVEHDRVIARGAMHGACVPTGWGLVAPTSFAVGEDRATVARWLDRTPFYARYVAELGGKQGVGEYLDLDRFSRGGVQLLLRWRAQRRA